MVGREEKKTNNKQQKSTTRFSRLVLGFLIADVTLVLYLSFGYIVPSRIDVPLQPASATTDRISDESAKPSPFLAEQPRFAQTAAAAVPVIDASSVAESSDDAAVDASADAPAAVSDSEPVVTRAVETREVAPVVVRPAVVDPANAITQDLPKRTS